MISIINQAVLTEEWDGNGNKKRVHLCVKGHPIVFILESSVFLLRHRISAKLLFDYDESFEYRKFVDEMNHPIDYKGSSILAICFARDQYD